MISIVAILAGISFVTLLNRNDRKEFETTVQKIVAILNDARDRSVAQQYGRDWLVSFSNSNTGCPTPLSVILEDSSLNKYTTIDVSSKVSFSTSSFSGACGTRKEIAFAGSTGVLTSASATINVYLVSNPSISSTISVSAFGVVNFTSSSISF